MDAYRFDSLARTITTIGSRRSTLAAAIGAALGVLGLADPEDAVAGNSGKCKPKCDECQKCDKGACHKTKHGKACKKGKCKPKPDDSACGGSGKCLAGACNLPPVCIQSGGNCSLANSEACCSDVCLELGVRNLCVAGASGKECLASTDCTSNRCTGFRCQ